MKRFFSRPGTAAWALVALLAFPAAASAAEGTGNPRPKSPFPTGAPQVQKVVEENAYFYRTLPYQPAVEVRAITHDKASYATPEEATIAAISAMLSADYGWFLETWTADSRRQLEARNQALGRSPEFWQEGWKKAFGGMRVELVTRIETGPYVLIAYSLTPQNEAAGAPGAKKKPFLTSVLKNDGGRWLATQEMAADPVLMFWDQPGYHVQKMARNVDPQ
ncbi:MAG: hypothetical protein U0002_21455 [Thermoanaerobaculia bacterium]